MLKEVFLEITDDVTSVQAATNRYLKALTGILANANIITPDRVRELCPVSFVSWGPEACVYDPFEPPEAPHGGESTGLPHD